MARTKQTAARRARVRARREGIRRVHHLCREGIRKPRRVLSRLSTAAIRPLLSHRTSSKKRIAMEEEEGVWRRSILMGEKCQPLNFPGVIYYDADGRPRSPLRRPLPSYPHAVITSG